MNDTAVVEKASRRIFISYRRDGGSDIAHRLYDHLKKRGYPVFLDREELRAGRFDQTLEQEVERCDIFLLILTKGCLTRCWNRKDWLRREIAHAINSRKNVVLVMQPDFVFPRKLPREIDSIRNYQGHCINYDFYAAFLEKLESALWVEQKTDEQPCPPADRTQTWLPMFFGAAALLIAGVLLFKTGFHTQTEENADVPDSQTVTVSASAAVPAQESEPTAESEKAEETSPQENVDSTKTDPISVQKQEEEDMGPVGNSQTNLCNGGFVAQPRPGSLAWRRINTRWLNSFEENNISYFYNTEERYIAVQWQDGEKTLKNVLKNDVDCRYLYVTEKWLYCVLEEDGTGTLYRAENDFANHRIGALQVVAENVLTHNGVAVHDGYVYYWDKAEEKGLMKCRTDGSDPQPLFSNGETALHFGLMTFYVAEDAVYFWDSTGGIYAVPTQGGVASHLVDTRERAGKITHAVVCDGKFYYVMEHLTDGVRTAPAEIWCAELDGSNDRQVTVLESSDMDIRVLNALDANLFFKIRTKDTSELYALYEGQDTLTRMCELS